MPETQPRFRDFFLTYAVLSLFFGISASRQLRRYPLAAVTAGSIFACLWMLLAFYLAPAFQGPRAWLAARLRGRVVVAVILFLMPYLVYATGTADFRWSAFARLLALGAVPLGIFVLVPVKNPRRINWQDLLVLLWLALPVLFRLIRGIWNVPVNLDFMTRLYLVGVGAWSFLIFRGLDDVGYEFRFSWKILRQALLNFAGFAVVAIPVGFVLEFIGWNPKWRGPRTFTFDLVTIFLFIAVTEELFFRGLLQNLLEKTWSSRYRAQATASVVFGFTHILHAPRPNWRYVILASVAGWFYGSAYRSTRSLMASATTHALVDTVWRTWFTRVRL